MKKNRVYLCLYRAVTSKRIELQSQGWSQIVAYKQGVLHGSIGRVRVGRGSMVAGQGQ